MTTPSPAPQLDPNAVYSELSRQYGLAFGELIHLRMVNQQQAEQITFLREQLATRDAGEPLATRD